MKNINYVIFEILDDSHLVDVAINDFLMEQENQRNITVYKDPSDIIPEGYTYSSFIEEHSWCDIGESYSHDYYNIIDDLIDEAFSDDQENEFLRKILSRYNITQKNMIEIFKESRNK